MPCPGVPPPPPGACAVSIRKSITVSAPTALDLAEVQLFGSSGVQIPRALLNFSMSSVHSDQGVPFSPSYCNDGNTSSVVYLPSGAVNKGPGLVCHTAFNADASPTLTINYPCSLGISKVVVSNCALSVCAARINDFTMDTSANGLAYNSFIFGGGLTTYTIIPALLPSGR